MKKLQFGGVLFLTVALIVFYVGNSTFIDEYIKSRSQFDVYRIAHAGGGIDGKTYTNSYEALDHNLKNGFKYFELDFIFTKDGHLVCHHRRHKQSTEFKKLKWTLRQFEKYIKEKLKYQQCTLVGLSDWMEKNPKAYIVTDVKRSNLLALKSMMDTLPNAKNRVIPQIYLPESFAQVKAMGYKQIIWTLYRTKANNDKIIEWVKKLQGQGPLAITMPEELAKTDLPKRLKEMNINSYVHTINSIEEANEYFSKYGITEVYTDFLLPNKSGSVKTSE